MPVTFEGTTPPEIGSNAFVRSPISTIIVPAGSTEAYAEKLAAAGVSADKIREKYKVTVQASEGGCVAVTPGVLFDAGEQVGLTCIADSGYTFSGWEVVSGNVTIGSDNTFAMPAAHVTVKALFMKNS